VRIPEPESVRRDGLFVVAIGKVVVLLALGGVIAGCA
jgi:hypothetical protein